MKRVDLFFTFLLLPTDAFALLAAAAAAYALRFHPFFTNLRPVIFDLTAQGFVPIAVACTGIWMLTFAVCGLYRATRRPLWPELIRIVAACSVAVIVVLGILFFARTFFESRFIVLAGWGFSIIFVIIARLILRGLQRGLLQYGIGVRTVVVIGKHKTADAIIDGFKQHPSLGFVTITRFSAFTHLARKKILALKAAHELDEVLLADPQASKETIQDLLFFTSTEQLTFKYIAELFSPGTLQVQMHMYAGIPVAEVKRTPLDGWGAIYKRGFDIVFSLPLIVITLPLQILIMLALFVEQPGRVLFSRMPNGSKTMRVGEGGRLFHYFKFRSMIKDAHKFRFDPAFIKKYGNMRDGTPLFKLKDDPRVTRVGAFLRKYSLDELPEFYLVLLGRMSLVGPRPHLPEEVARYEPWQKKVLNVKPGITGMAQVSGRADLDFDEEVRLDTYYLEHWTPLLDLYILLKTPLVVLFRKGAY